VAFLDKRSGIKTLVKSGASEGALFGLIFALCAGVSLFLSFLIRTAIGAVVSIGATAGAAIPLALLDLVGNGIAVSACGIGSGLAIIVLGAAGATIGSMFFNREKK